MDVMPLVPETDGGRTSTISLGNPLTRRTMWLMPKTMSTPAISSRVFGAYSMTRILYKYTHLPTLTLFSHFFLQGQHTLSNGTSRENTITLPFQLTAVYHHKNVCTMQPFSYLLQLFGEIFSSFKNNRNFINPSKERNKQHGIRHVPPNIHY